MMWKQGSRKSKNDVDEREIALDKQSKAARNDEQPGNAKSKKRAVFMVLGALLALCLAAGMVNCAASCKQAESIKRPSPEQVKKNAKTDPNADKDKVDEESQKAEEGVTDEPSGGNTGASKPETGGNSTSSGNGGSTGNNGNSGSNGGSGSSNNGGDSKPQHTHNWVPQTTIVHHEAQHQTVHHDAVVEYRCICNGCGADITGFETSHFKDNFFNGCQSYTNAPVIVQEAWDETVEVSPAWDETVTTGHSCSGCGATK